MGTESIFNAFEKFFNTDKGLIMYIPLLISSHSKASDLWPITAHFLKKHWKHKPVFLGANGENSYGNVPIGWCYVNNGEDRSFCQSLRSYVEFLDSEYIILMLDDFIILEQVKQDQIEKAVNFLRQHEGVYFRLVPNPPGDKVVSNGIRRIDVRMGVPYITSLQMAIWKRSFLIELLKYNFSPWEFETRAGKTTEALSHSDDFYVSEFPLVNYTHYVEKGKFYPFIRDIIEKEGLNLNSPRPFLSEKELKTIKDPQWKKFIRQIIPRSFYNVLREFTGKEPL
jgi:hypothetical protein